MVRRAEQTLTYQECGFSLERASFGVAAMSPRKSFDFLAPHRKHVIAQIRHTHTHHRHRTKSNVRYVWRAHDRAESSAGKPPEFRETHLNAAFIFMNLCNFKIAFNCSVQTVSQIKLHHIRSILDGCVSSFSFANLIFAQEMCDWCRRETRPTLAE